MTNSALTIALVLSLIACSPKSRMPEVSDFELAERSEQCRDNKATNPGHGHACENIRKECKYRAEKLGNYICSSGY